jgi:hypothetical protein
MTISTRNYKKYNAYTNAYTDKQGKRSVEVCLNTEKVSTANIPTFYFTEKNTLFVIGPGWIRGKIKSWMILKKLQKT